MNSREYFESVQGEKLVDKHATSIIVAPFIDVCKGILCVPVVNQLKSDSGALFVNKADKQHKDEWHIKYSPDADYTYLISSDEQQGDGTWIKHFVNICNVLEKLITAHTLDKQVLADEVITQIDQYEITYCVGDFILLIENRPDLAPEGEEQKKYRMSCYLPCQISVVKRE